jgi:hypothetical protein
LLLKNVKPQADHVHRLLLEKALMDTLTRVAGIEEHDAKDTGVA